MKKVLIADDDGTLRRIMRATLEGKDREILEAADGAQAVDVASRQHPDLILLNALLPRIDGIGVCRALKANTATSDITILMLAAPGDLLAGQTQSPEQLAAAGADYCLTKPFSPLELLRLTEAALAR